MSSTPADLHQLADWLERDATGSSVIDEAVRVIHEHADCQHSFNLRWDAQQCAIKRWQAAHPGNDLVWPDHADLCVWLMDQLASVQSWQMAWQPIETAPKDGTEFLWLRKITLLKVGKPDEYRYEVRQLRRHWFCDVPKTGPGFWMTPYGSQPDSDVTGWWMPLVVPAQPTGEKPLPTMEDALAAGDAIIAAEQREWPVNPVCFECGHLFSEHKNAGVGCPVQTEGGK